MFRCNLPPALLTKWPGYFTCHCGNTRVERTQNKSQHTKLTPEKKILPPLLSGFELATFRSRVRRSYQQATPAPYVMFKSTLTGRNLFFHITFLTRGPITWSFSKFVAEPFVEDWPASWLVQSLDESYQSVGAFGHPLKPHVWHPTTLTGVGCKCRPWIISMT